MIYNQEHEDGVVLVLFALLAGTIFGFVALCVDLSRATASHEQEDQMARYAATAAVERFFTSRSGDYCSRLNDARNRAEQILEQNYIMGNLAIKLDSLCLTGESCDNDSSNGIIEAGRWVTDMDACNNATPYCTCYAEKGFPCFQPAQSTGASCGSVSNDELARITSFKVNLQLKKSTGGIKTAFASALGIPEVWITSSATATVRPRHAVFAADLSGSAAGENYLRRSGLPPEEQYLNSMYAFRLASLPSGAVCDNSFPPGGGSNPCPNTDSCDAGMFYQEWDSFVVYNALLDDRSSDTVSIGDPPLLRTEDPRIHYKSDYTCHILNFGNGPEMYLVDTFRDSNHLGPQPLVDILATINGALEKFRVRAVANDMVSVVGFDQEIAARLRVYPLVKPNLRLLDFRKMRIATDTTSTLAVYHQVTGGMIIRDDKNNTNIPAVLYQALGMLDPETPPPGWVDDAESFVVLFTDGVSTCSNFDSTYSSSCAPPSTYSCGLLPTTSNGVNLNPQINHLIKLSRDCFVPQKVAIHVALVGDLTLPNTMLYPFGDGHCMDDKQYRQLCRGTTSYWPYTNTPSWSNWQFNYDRFRDGIIGSDFSFGNDLWRTLAYPTGGMFQPVRRSCQPGSDITGSIEAQFCGGSAPSCYARMDIAEYCNDPTPDYFWLDCVNNTPYQEANWYETVLDGTSPYVDHRGRLLCDPRGRSKQEQISAMIDDIMKDNPIALVN